MDEVCGQDVVEFVRHIRVATFFHEDNLTKVKAMADKYVFSHARMSKYLWLQVYCAELVSTEDELEPPMSVATRYGFRWSWFEDYHMARAEVLRYIPDDDFRPERKPYQTSLFLDPWDEEEAVTADTQEDAAMTGD